MLHFTKIIIENFGPYKLTQEINLGKDQGISIIWGNNGLGKTTLLNVFRFALFGKVLGRTNTKFMLKDIANWESYQEGIYGFRVVLSIINDDDLYELTRQYSPRPGITVPISNEDFVESVFLKRNSSFISSEERDHVLRSIMPEEVSRFFLFDGELLKEYEDLLREESNTAEIIKDSIEQILGVPILTNGLVDVRSAEKEYSKQLSKIAQMNNSTKTLGKVLESKQVELKNHEDELQSLRSLNAELAVERADIEELMKQTEKTRDLLKEKKTIEASIEKNHDRKKQRLNQIIEVTRNAWSGMLSARIKNAILTIDQDIEMLVSKRTRYQISAQVLTQIESACKSGLCPLCNQQIPEGILSMLNHKLSQDQGFEDLTIVEAQTLVSLQSRKEQLSKLTTLDGYAQIVTLEQALDDISVEISDAEQRIREIEKSLDKSADYQEVETLPMKYSKCLQQVDNVTKGISEEKEIIESTRSEIKIIEDKIKLLATDAALLNADRKRELCEKVKNIFEDGVVLYRERLKNQVERDAEKIFLDIANQKEYAHLKINSNYGLSIIHTSGSDVPIRSSGYEHIVALSLIGALHNNAPLQGPIIMDSPFGRLDPDHKVKMISALPKLAEQVLLLVYKEEIDCNLTRQILGPVLLNEFHLQSVSAFHTKILRV